MESKLYHGAAFYPELWDEKVIAQDIEKMKAVGINVVRMGEFAWAKVEIEEGKLDSSFFEKVIADLYQNGIETILCTPTPTPPIWLTDGHPERLHVDENLTVMGHGSRQHICTNNSYFRKRARIIIEYLAQTLGALPGVIGWQLDNEFKAHVSECFCDACKKEWHQWLKSRYQTIEHLNEAWGTMIWSEYYQSFEQVPQPGPTPFLHNSSLKTMYSLFTMGKLAEFASEQAELIRKYSQAPVTHNGSFGFKVDNEKLYKNLDFAAYDTYAGHDNYSSYVMNCDFWRNVKKGKSYWVMETSPSFSASLVSYAVPHPNGYLKVEAVTAYALGGSAFCYWLWRQQRAGCEQPHASIISAWGEPTVGYANVIEVEKARKELEPIILASRPRQAEVAMTYSDRAKVFLLTEPYKKMNYRGLTANFYNKILQTGIHRDLILENQTLEGYKLLFTPFVRYISADYLRHAQSFVENGGIWVIGPLTGDRTEEHTLHTDAALGKLEKIAGVKTVFNYPLDGTDTKGNAFNLEAPLSMLGSLFEVKEAQVVGSVSGGISPGLAFLTERRLGKGKVVMLGAMPTDAMGETMLEKLITHYADEAKVTLRAGVTPGTIVAPRYGKGYEIWVVVNMDGYGGMVMLPHAGTDMLNNSEVNCGEFMVGKYEYRVIRF